MDTNESTPLPPWLGFAVGLLGGVALSAGLIGLVLGYSLAGGAISAGGGAVVGVPTPPDVPEVPAAPSKPVAPVTAKDHVSGNRDAKISVIEYSDFECPFCERNAPTLDAVLKKYGDDVNIVYRHFPLSFHPSAQKLAEASECVAEQKGDDGFWSFHDGVFALATVSASPDVLGPLAKAAGADEAKFKSCLESGKHAELVKEHMNSGIEAGVQGTPGNFVLNNETEESKEISGAVPQSTFDAEIDRMLKS